MREIFESTFNQPLLYHILQSSWKSLGNNSARDKVREARYLPALAFTMGFLGLSCRGLFLRPFRSPYKLVRDILCNDYNSHFICNCLKRLCLSGNMAEWSKAPESGSSVGYLVRKGEGSNPSVVIVLRSSRRFIFFLYFIFGVREVIRFFEVCGESTGEGGTRRKSRYGNMAEWSKAPDPGSSLSFLVRKGEGSNPSVVISILIDICHSFCGHYY